MWREFLTLTKREQTGILSLFFLLVILIGLLWIKPAFKEEQVDKELQACADQLKQSNSVMVSEDNFEPLQYFSFDPNNVSKNDMLRLGFSNYASDNLIKYRNAGGKFNSIEKLAQIYGMDSVHLKNIEPYIIFNVDQRLSVNNLNNSTKVNFKVDLNLQDSLDLIKLKLNSSLLNDILQIKKEFYFNQRISLNDLQSWSFSEWISIKDTLVVRKRADVVQTDLFQIELNSADTAELALLKGIGKVLARRIVYYRNRLGGFYEINQLAEVEGISPIVINDNQKYILIDTSFIKKININKASLRRMKEHPYMDFYMAKDIYESRKESVVNLKDIIQMRSFAKANKNRIRQYFTDN
ncbi:helix-hairpin-helix domain-containing protein [Carboxylicivirga caseinilyticus]|uniref:helix-hairpin-helix domain-containing protein n=1 Tax=Carboxylicivirga caseinilyticus TaxID=3417572 RepID=UPI003D35483C|nr:helix-hairpin-helix domain-containing protein [Marinilabiliaceae bacterium A049]